jgi:hypothetical protein
VDLYDDDQLDQARARFAELSDAAHPRITNAATRSIDRFILAWKAHDWSRVVAEFGPAFRQVDHRKLVRLDIDRASTLESLRKTLQQPSSDFTAEVIATRGDRLALARWLWSGTGEDFGPSEIEFLEIVHAGADGHQEVAVLFDLDDLDAAYADLDARWEAGEGAEHLTGTAWGGRFGPALARRDWDAIAAAYSPSFVGFDHRLAGWGTQDRSVLVKAMQEMVALAPDARMRLDHIRAATRGFIAEAVWVGTREGGAFESPFVVVSEFDAIGQIQRQDFYDPHHLPQALARFDELRGGGEAAATSPSPPSK